MIIGRRKDLCHALYRELLRYRYEVFVERLGWKLPCGDSREEQDDFDREETVHVLALDEQGRVAGCARLLPTTCSYLLQQVFPSLVVGRPLPRSRDVWELSRFSALPNHATGRGHASTTVALSLFATALGEARARGASEVIGVLSVELDRFFRRIDVPIVPLGPAQRCDGTWVFAGSVPVGLADQLRVRVVALTRSLCSERAQLSLR